MQIDLSARVCVLLAPAAGVLSLPAALDARPPPAFVFAGAYTAEVRSVATGGLKRGAVCCALAEAAVQADLAIALSFGWPAFLSADTRNTGPTFYRSALGSFGILSMC